MNHGRQLPRFIRELRHSLQLTQQQFAEALGASGQDLVSQWETGDSRPQRTWVEKIGRLANEQRSQGASWSFLQILKFAQTQTSAPKKELKLVTRLSKSLNGSSRTG